MVSDDRWLKALVRALASANVTVVSSDLEQGPRFTLGSDEQTVLFELAPRTEDEPCYARTERFDVSARAMRTSESLDAAARATVERALDAVRAFEASFEWPEREPGGKRVEVREIAATQGLVAEGGGRYYLNPYVGCTIGCPFCWVAERADLGRAFAGRSRRPWGRWVDVKTGLADVLRREVETNAPGIVRMSPVVTDPYQPLEKRFRVTRECLEVLLPAGFTPVILTRAKRVLDDLELIASWDNVAVGLSIPTDDDEVRHAFEPGADSIADRVDALRALHAAGVRTFAVVQPVLPMNAARLVETLAPITHAVRLDRMHEVKRALPLYEAAGREDAATPAFANELLAALEAGFEERGVKIDLEDDLAGLLF